MSSKGNRYAEVFDKHGFVWYKTVNTNTSKKFGNVLRIHWGTDHLNNIYIEQIL